MGTPARTEQEPHGPKAIAFSKDGDAGGKEDRDAPAEIVYGMADGTGVALRKKHTSKTHKYWSDRISDGKVESVLDSLWKGKYGKPVGDAMKEYKYFRRNKDRMKYDVYRKNGWFYGSGDMESGCKTVVGQRFKQSGMIWSLNGTKNLLALRTLCKSNRLDNSSATSSQACRRRPARHDPCIKISFTLRSCKSSPATAADRSDAPATHPHQAPSVP